MTGIEVNSEANFPKLQEYSPTGQYVNTYWLVNWWTGQYPILAYTTWRDLNQSQPQISIRGITNANSFMSSNYRCFHSDLATLLSLVSIQRNARSKHVTNAMKARKARKQVRSWRSWRNGQNAMIEAVVASVSSAAFVALRWKPCFNFEFQDHFHHVANSLFFVQDGSRVKLLCLFIDLAT